MSVPTRWGDSSGCRGASPPILAPGSIRGRGIAGSCYPTANRHGAALFSWSPRPYWLCGSLNFPPKKETSSKQSPLIVTRTSLRTQNEELDTQQRMGWGQWHLAWQWDIHGGGWWWLFPAHGLSQSCKLHCCDRVNLDLNHGRSNSDSRFLTVTHGPSPNPQILMCSFPLVITA